MGNLTLMFSQTTSCPGQPNVSSGDIRAEDWKNKRGESKGRIDEGDF